MNKERQKESTFSLKKDNDRKTHPNESQRIKQKGRRGTTKQEEIVWGQ